MIGVEPVPNLTAWKDFDAAHGRCTAGNPEGLTLAISTPQDSYRTGEFIPITLTFINYSDVKYLAETIDYDRSGRLWDILFYVDGPAGGAVDPMATKEWGIGGGLGGGYKAFGRYSQTFELNKWIRFDVPGTYRVFCGTWRVRTAGREWDYIYLYSQILEIRIERADEKFIADTVAKALKDIDSGDAIGRSAGFRRLWYLATHESVDTLVELFDENRIYAYRGLIGARDWEYGRKILLGRMADPDVVVESTYVRALGHFSVPYEDHIIVWDPNDDDGTREKYSDLRARKKKAEREYLEQFGKVYKRKRGRAFTEACALLAENGIAADGLGASFAKEFKNLSNRQQETYLWYRWEKIRCSEMEGVLEEILAQPAELKDWRQTDMYSLAMKRYLEYQPGKARAMILEDMKRPYPLMSRDALLALADESLPELDDVFSEHLLRGGSSDKISAIIERYATKRILPDIIACLRNRGDRGLYAPQRALLRYWIKHDYLGGLDAVIETVERIVRSDPEGKRGRSVLYDVLVDYYSPEAERAVIALMWHYDTGVVQDAIRVIKLKGSSECVDQLLARLISWSYRHKEETFEEIEHKEVDKYYSIAGCLLANGSRWKYTTGQKELLKKYLRTESHRRVFKARYENPERDGG